jgi:hypothetical protein
MNFRAKYWWLLTLLATIPAGAVSVKTVPWDTSNLASPHTAILGTSIVLGATVDETGGVGPFTFAWNFGDGNTQAATPVSNPYDISATHAYSLGSVGTNYTAVVTVTDTGNGGATYTANYLVIIETNNLQSKVNIAIDKGLWILHTSMWRTNSPANGQPVNWGGWDSAGGTGSSTCSNSHVCFQGYGGIDANDVQAFEVKGHLDSGPASDPYTDDVARGLARIEYFLIPHAVGSKTFSINPANHATRCSDGTIPAGYGTSSQSCSGHGSLIQIIPGAASCTSGSCMMTFDQNSNGQFIVIGNDPGPMGYESGMFVDVLVATSNPTGVAKAGPAGVVGKTYKDLAADLMDGIAYCQNPYDPFNGTSNGFDDGGAWQYNCAVNSAANYNDNSVSQWNAIGLIGGHRGFGLAIPQITMDMNQVWTTWSEDWAGTASFNGSTLKGSYGYNEFDNEVWGPFADTPSGMVQLAMTGAGRTSSGAPDQRWNLAETFYRDSFCLNTGSAYTSPREYTYGLFSFSKSMLLHDPGGVLTPITMLADQPSGANPIDWYAAEAANGAACDGVAATLVSRQFADGTWFGHNYYSTQFYFETAWAIIMLNKTVFISCVSDLSGKGTAGGRNPPRADLSWTPMPNVSSYHVLRGTVSGGPYSVVGNATGPAFSDVVGLVNQKTYYYVLQPQNSSGATVCQSNQATIPVP